MYHARSGISSRMIFSTAMQKASFAVEVADVVDAVEEGDYLGVVLDLAELLGAAVQVADVWFDLDDAFAVDPQHHAEDAVRAGMLRPHVDHEIDGVEGVGLCGLCIG